MTGVLVPAPKCKPAMFGLLAVSEIVPAPDDEHWQGGIEYDLPTCEDMFVISSDCLVQDIEKPTENGSLSTADAVPFTMVAAYKCATAGRIPDEAWDHAKDRLDRGEARTLERAFWTGVDVEGNPLEQSLNGNVDVVDLTPGGGAVTVTDGLAMLEGWAGINMPCSPVIHASRGIGVYLTERGLIEILDGELISKGTGTLISIGGGYLSTGPGVARPEPAAVAQAAGGTLAADTYEYAVTALTATGETLPSAEVSATTVGATGSVDLSWPAVDGATGYNIYGRQSGALGLIGTTALLVFTDDGSVAPAAAPPTSNTSGTPADGEAWFYITGGIRIIRGETFYTPPRGQLGSAVDRAINDVTVFAERTYAIEQDCVSAAVRVDLATCCG